MKTGRRRPPSKPQQRMLAVGNRLYAPPATSCKFARPTEVDISADAKMSGPLRPAWLRLGAWVRVEGERLAIVSIQPKAGGGWELMGHKTAARWYDADQVEPL